MAYVVRLCLWATVALMFALAPAAAQLDVRGGDEPLKAAIRLFEAGQLEDALAAFQAVLRLRPDDPTALRYLGLAHLRLDRPAEAEAVLARAGADPPVLYALGVALARLGRIDEARRSFRR